MEPSLPSRAIDNEISQDSSCYGWARNRCRIGPEMYGQFNNSSELLEVPWTAEKIVPAHNPVICSRAVTISNSDKWSTAPMCQSLLSRIPKSTTFQSELWKGNWCTWIELTKCFTHWFGLVLLLCQLKALTTLPNSFQTDRFKARGKSGTQIRPATAKCKEQIKFC